MHPKYQQKIKLHILGVPMNKLGNWLITHSHLFPDSVLVAQQSKIIFPQIF